MTLALQIVLPEEMRATIRQAIWMEGLQTGILISVAVAVAVIWLGRARQ